jgi:effector-binding domain-containing protein
MRLLFLILFLTSPAFAQEWVQLAPRFAVSETKKVKEDDLYHHFSPLQRYSLSQENGDGENILVERFTPLETPHETSNAITPQGRFLRFTHFGPYETIDQTYEEIADYLDEKKLTAKDDVLEEFVQRPPLFKENQLVTHIYIQVKE